MTSSDEAKLELDTAGDTDRKKQTHDNTCLGVVYPEDWEEHSEFAKILLDADMVGGGFLVSFRTLSKILDWLLDEPWSDGAVFTIWPVLKPAANSTKKSDYKLDFGPKLWILTWEGG